MPAFLLHERGERPLSTGSATISGPPARTLAEDENAETGKDSLAGTLDGEGGCRDSISEEGSALDRRGRVPIFIAS
jgi:hypothetical protein